MTYEIIPERPEDAALIDPLLDLTFGFERRQKTVYRLREDMPPVPGLCFSAISPVGGLLGTCSARSAEPKRRMFKITPKRAAAPDRIPTIFSVVAPHCAGAILMLARDFRGGRFPVT